MTPGRSLPPKTIGPFDRAHRVDGAPRHNLPEPLTRLMIGRPWQMIGDVLERAIDAAVIEAENAGAAKDANIGQRRQFGFDPFGPFGPAQAVDRCDIRREAGRRDENPLRKG